MHLIFFLIWNNDYSICIPFLFYFKYIWNCNCNILYIIWTKSKYFQHANLSSYLFTLHFLTIVFKEHETFQLLLCGIFRVSFNIIIIVYVVGLFMCFFQHVTFSSHTLVFHVNLIISDLSYSIFYRLFK